MNIVCAGTNGKFSLDDALCAGLIVNELIKSNEVKVEIDDTALALVKIAQSEKSIPEILREVIITHFFYLLVFKRIWSIFFLLENIQLFLFTVKDISVNNFHITIVYFFKFKIFYGGYNEKNKCRKELDQHKIPYTLKEYEVDENDLSAVHVALTTNTDLDRIFKTLSLLNEKNELIIACIPGGDDIDL